MTYALVAGTAQWHRMARLAAVLMGKFVLVLLVVAGVEVMEVAETEAEAPPPPRRPRPLLRHHLPK